MLVNFTMDDNMEHISDENNKPELKKPKRGIIFLATIPPYMNVTRIRELFGQYGTVGRVYLQLADADPKPGQATKSKKKKVSNKFIEGWIEFERKSIAKKVASTLNNTQVSTRKKSKHYDCIWNIKYLPNFKWTHLHERLAYEKTVRRQKLRAEIQLAKKKSNFFTINLDKHQKNKRFINKDLTENRNKDIKDEGKTEDVVDIKGRQEFLKSLFSN